MNPIKIGKEERAVASLAEILALERGHRPEKAIQIKKASVLHDVGKSLIPSQILNKPDKLTPYEFDIMKQHTKLGANLLLTMKGDLGEMARFMALLHHENYSGTGYWSISNQVLPEYVRIVHICDIFCALVHLRCYKPPWPPTEALEYIKNQAGKQFCPKLSETFISLIQNDKGGCVTAIFMNSAEVEL